MNNVQYSANITRQANKGISLQRRPLGKSRAVSYNNLIRTNMDQMTDCVSKMRFKFKKTTHVLGADHWYLEDNGSAHYHNLEHFLYISELLRRKQGVQPAIQTLVEFIIFMITSPSLRTAVGAYRPQKKTSTSTLLQDTLPTPTTTPTSTQLDDADWGDFDAPQFDDDGL